MTQSFDEWFKENYPNQYAFKDSTLTCKSFYDGARIGAQSRQAEIDALQKRIDEALHAADESCGVSVAAFVKLNKILKGNKDD